MPVFKHFPLPDVGEGLTEAEILAWHVAPGDDVKVNQIIVEIETAKAAVELPCPYQGKVTKLLAEAGQTVDVGAPIIVIDVDPTSAPTDAPAEAHATSGEEKVPNLVGYGPKAGSVKRRPRIATPPSVPQTTRVAVRPPTALSPPPVPPPRETSDRNGSAGGYVPLAKPPVRILARELGVDLRKLSGSGPAGVITRDDVRQAVAPTTSAAISSARFGGAPLASRGERRVPIRGVRRATASAMVHSAFTAPHVTEFLTVDVTPMMALRAKLKDSPEFRDVKLTPLAFAAKAVCLATRRTPDVNASWDEQAGEIVYKSYVHLGIAVATPRGLVVPKIRDADTLSLRDLAVALDELSSVAREGKTPPEDMVGGTITITNVGVFGVDTGTPIINPGESAILAFGAIRDLPWVVDGQVVPRKVCQLAVSFDHRVVDGEQGSKFLADVGALLADPATAITY